METNFISLLHLDQLNLTDIITIIGSVFTGVITSFLIFRKRLSADNLDIAKNTAEKDFISVLMSERDKALAEREKIIERLQIVDEEKNEMRVSLTSLTVELTSMQKQLLILQELIKTLMTLPKNQNQII